MFEATALLLGIAWVYLVGYAYHKKKLNKNAILQTRDSVIKAMQTAFAGKKVNGVREIRTPKKDSDGRKEFLNYIMPAIKSIKAEKNVSADDIAEKDVFKNTGGSVNLGDKGEYLECVPKAEQKINVQVFNIKRITDIKPVIVSLRAGNRIPLIHSKDIRQWDMLQYKRALKQLNRIADANSAKLYMLNPDNIVIVPSFAKMSIA